MPKKRSEPKPVFRSDHPDHDTRCTETYCVEQERIVIEDDGEADLYTQGAPLPVVQCEEGRLLDEVAIQLFVKGWPLETIYQRAELFLRVRACHRAGEQVLPYVGKGQVQKGMAKR